MSGRAWTSSTSGRLKEGSGTDAPEAAAPRLEVGRIARAHGIRGEVIVEAVTNRVERFAGGAELFAGDRRLVVLRAAHVDEIDVSMRSGYRVGHVVDDEDGEWRGDNAHGRMTESVFREYLDVDADFFADLPA